MTSHVNSADFAPCFKHPVSLLLHHDCQIVSTVAIMITPIIDYDHNDDDRSLSVQV